MCIRPYHSAGSSRMSSVRPGPLCNTDGRAFKAQLEQRVDEICVVEPAAHYGSFRGTGTEPAPADAHNPPVPR
jgi:hypothetical protein